jgi:uncharacterized protein (TIGR03435 family)
VFDAVAWAYDVQGYQISSAPAWITACYFQIHATTSTPVPAVETLVIDDVQEPSLD